MATTQKSYQQVTAQRRNTFWKLVPWTGVLSLILAFCCGIAALVIGIVSNNLPLNSWKLSTGIVQPSVLLSTVATLANALLRIAFAQGVTIQWWLQIHQGVSIGELCALYTHGTTTRGLVTMLSKFSRVTFAAFIMILLLADGPILQRASLVSSLSNQSSSNLTVVVSTSPFVQGATGIITSHDGYNPNTYTTAFSQVMQKYSARSSMSIPQMNYSGTTTMDLLGPGWDIRCDNGSSPYGLMSFEDWQQWNDTRNPNYHGPPSTQTMFDTTVDFDASSTVLIQTSYKSTMGVNGTLSWRNCTLQEAVVRYPLRIVDGVVTLQPMPLSENRTEYLVYRQIELNGFTSKSSYLIKNFVDHADI